MMSSKVVGVVVSVALLSFVPRALGQEKEPDNVKKAREQLAALRSELEKTRGAKLVSDVPVRAETAQAFKDSLKEDLDKELPVAKAEACSRALARLGLVPKGYDIRKGILEASADTTLAFYDVDKKYLGVVQPDELTGVDGQSTVIHELLHALQDQRFDLDHYDKALRDENDDDATLARTFVVEGEATYVENRWVLRHKLDQLAAKLEAADAETTVRMGRRHLRDENGQPFDKSDELPLFYWRSAWEPYSKGALLVAAAYDKGGWKAVDELFTRPPRSTEQVLHPAKLIGPTRDEPIVLSLPDLGRDIGEGWKKSFETTIGELGVHCFFVERGEKQAAKDASEGWGGDRLLAFEREPAEGGARGPTVLVWFTTWDSEKDAEEFEAAAARVEKSDPRSGESALERRGKDVAIVEGAPEGRAKALLEAAFAKAKRVSR